MSNWARPRGDLDWQEHHGAYKQHQSEHLCEGAQEMGWEVKHRAETGSAEGGTRLAGDWKWDGKHQVQPLNFSVY